MSDATALEGVYSAPPQEPRVRTVSAAASHRSFGMRDLASDEAPRLIELACSDLAVVSHFMRLRFGWPRRFLQTNEMYLTYIKVGCLIETQGEKNVMLSGDVFACGSLTGQTPIA